MHISSLKYIPSFQLVNIPWKWGFYAIYLFYPHRVVKFLTIAAQ
jgi:hypothetical protein